jgi:hypothetical protein
VLNTKDAGDCIEGCATFAATGSSTPINRTQLGKNTKVKIIETRRAAGYTV